MRKFRSGGLAAAILLAALATATAAAQQPPANQQPPQSVFGEQIDVRVVNVEVVVTDKQGNRVAGFTPQDFRLKVDGKVVPIEYFNEVRGGSAIARAESTAPNIKGLPSQTPGSPAGTSYLVFIDDFFSLAPRRNEVLKSLKDQLSRLGPDDRMAIVAFNGGSIEMLSSWSNSVRQLGAAIEKAIGEPAQGLTRLAELRSFESSRRLISGGPAFDTRQAFSQRLDIEEVEYAERLGAQTERVVSAATSTLRGFASPPGRKVMLLLAGGWPFSPADYVVNNPNRPILDRDIPRGDEIFRPLADTANRLGYTIYPLDVPGVESGSSADASLASPSVTGRREMEVPVTLAIPADAITFVPVNGKYTAELELRISAVDAGGARAPVPVIPFTVTTATQPKAGTAVRYETKLKLRRMIHHLTVAVFDPLSGKILTAQTDVAPPPK